MFPCHVGKVGTLEDLGLEGFTGFFFCDKDVPRACSCHDLSFGKLLGPEHFINLTMITSSAD